MRDQSVVRPIRTQTTQIHSRAESHPKERSHFSSGDSRGSQNDQCDRQTRCCGILKAREKYKCYWLPTVLISGTLNFIPPMTVRGVSVPYSWGHTAADLNRLRSTCGAKQDDVCQPVVSRVSLGG